MALLSGLLVTSPSVGYGEAVCMPALELEAALIDWYQERPLGEPHETIVLWAAEAGETWTIVKYLANGTACSLESGTDWNASWSLATLAENAKNAN